MTQCPCGSLRPAELCCAPVISGRPAPTAEALMRSRYTAYATGNVDYIQRTAAGEALLAFDRAGVLASMRDTRWLGLEILETEAGGETDETGTVTFRARYREGGREHVLEEQSEFRRLGGEWRYVKGTAAVAPAVTSRGQPGRNDPCPCGSGRKYKKCHGA